VIGEPEPGGGDVETVVASLLAVLDWLAEGESAAAAHGVRRYLTTICTLASEMR